MRVRGDDESDMELAIQASIAESKKERQESTVNPPASVAPHIGHDSTNFNDQFALVGSV